LTLFSDVNDNGVVEQDESGDILLVLDENFVFVADMDLVKFRLSLIAYLALTLYLATFYRVAYG